MIIIRPTASLAKRMKEKLEITDETSTAQMGDWYANDIVLNRKQFILCASSTSRLAVILDAAPYVTFPDRLTDAVSGVLRAIGVDESKIQEERAQMNEFKLAKTANKSILGSLNEYKFQLETYAHMERLDFNDPLEMSLMLSKVISLVIPEGYPKDAALKIFGQEIPKPAPLKAVVSAGPKLYVVK
ncbi:MAG: hypothetical protein JNJ49_08575 [Bdellovibrionaceae bacterium]|nr:hypothetical protein [Pseudobdellovibrionaceae bacterium]